MDLHLATDRLLLRPLAATDLAFEIEMLTDPEIMRYAGGPRSREQVIRDMPRAVKRAAGGAIGVWCVLRRSNEEKLGTALLLPLPIERETRDWRLSSGPDMPKGDIEVGYRLVKSEWGKGLATEACGRLLRFAFEETPLDEIVAVTDPANAASQNVLKKCGLREEGMRRAFAADCAGFRITRAQWSAARAEDQV